MRKCSLRLGLPLERYRTGIDSFAHMNFFTNNFSFESILTDFSDNMMDKNLCNVYQYSSEYCDSQNLSTTPKS